MKYVLVACALTMISVCAFPSIPLTINHQGIVKVNGEPFTGTGQFRFGFVDATGKWLWTNDGTHIGQAAGANPPDSPVPLSCSYGIYNVRLGDTSITGMVAVPSTVFDSDQVKLRVIFDDGTIGPQVLVPDQPVTSAGYAYHARNADLLEGKTAAQVMPSGIITMWSGTIATIPEGWALCDGTNGTPDLRDRFVVGARQDEGGVPKTNVKGTLMQTGGEHEHTLTVNEMPSHTHMAKGYNTGTDNTANIHYHTCGQERLDIETTSAGGSQPHENCPPFYALAFIMKL